MKSSRLSILSQPLFIVALGLLLLNDFYLKYQYSNFLTGKLSDFLGLFIFPYFLSSLCLRWTKASYLATVGLFIFWKSTFSQEVIEYCQSIGIGINRTVDYTDLIALTILPISYRYLKIQLIREIKVHKALTIPLSIISVFAFWATTLPREKAQVNIDINKKFTLLMSKSDFFNSLTPGHGYSSGIEENLKDSLFYLTFDVNQHRAQITVLSTITSIDSTRTLVTLDSILYGYITGTLFSGVDGDDIDDFKSLTSEEFRSYFEKNFIEPVEENKGKYLYYDNKKIYDLHERK